ncbi:MAG: phosphoglucosamine mutase, partial [Bacteroidota bacterium]
SHLATSNLSASRLRQTYPSYHIVKNKIQLTPEIDVDNLLTKLHEKYKKHQLTTIDGLKIDLQDGWIHLRKSNTEPIVRIYAEGTSEVIARNLAGKIMADMTEIIRG